MMHGMGDEHHAVLMRNLDEDERNELIAHAKNVIDARDKFEYRMALASGAFEFLPPMLDGDD
jgi:hypothetical protein